jgi:hypothetical protein
MQHRLVGQRHEGGRQPFTGRIGDRQTQLPVRIRDEVEGIAPDGGGGERPARNL